MEALKKMNDLVAAISVVNGDNAELQAKIKDGKDSITSMVREVATECHNEGMTPIEAFAAFKGLVTQAETLNPDLKINKVYSTGIKGYVTMLEAGVNIEVFTDKGKPASIPEAVAYIASDDVKRIAAAKARIAKVIKGCSNKDKREEAKALEAYASALEYIASGGEEAPVTQVANG